MIDAQTKHDLLNKFRRMAGVPEHKFVATVAAEEAVTAAVEEAVEPITEPVEVQPEAPVVEAEEESTTWMKDKKLVQEVVDEIIAAMNKASSGKHDIHVSGSPKVSSHRNTLYVSYPLKGSDFGIFNFIVSDVTLDLQIHKRTDEDGSFSVKAALHYDHHGRGSNGYDIGWFFLNDDMKVDSKYTRLTMDNKKAPPDFE